MLNNSIISLLWEKKIIIIAGIFVAITIYNYVYKKVLRWKKIKRLLNVKKELQIIKSILSEMTDFNSAHFDKIEDIREHEQIKAAVDGLRVQMSAGFEVININIKTLDEKTDNILDQVKKTNGRVTAVENEVDNELGTVRFLKKRKIVAGLIILGIFWLYDQFSNQDLIDKIIGLIF
jgi:hypothetical protein